LDVVENRDPTVAAGAKSGKPMKIGELAKKTAESTATIRYWTNQKLLEVDEHTDSGYRLYDEAMVDRVEEIRRLQTEERRTLQEIKNRFLQKN